MNVRTYLQLFCLLGLGVPAIVAAQNQSAWVSDQFEIMLRSGPSTSNAIELMLGSGSRLEVLERDRESGYSRVRTAGGTEGWVLTRYLMGEPAAREQLEQLTEELTNATTEGSSMNSQLGAVKGEYDKAQSRIAALERDKSQLQAEVDEIKRTAANVLSIDSQNKVLRQQLTDAEIKVDILEQENADLSSKRTRNWFITGALVLFGGILLGLILPRLRYQRRSRYDSF